MPKLFREMGRDSFRFSQCQLGIFRGAAKNEAKFFSSLHIPTAMDLHRFWDGVITSSQNLTRLRNEATALRNRQDFQRSQLT